MKSRACSSVCLLVVLSLTVLLAPAAPVAAEEIKLQPKDFKFRPPENVENPDTVFVFNEDEDKLAFYTNGPADASFTASGDGEYAVVISASGDAAESVRPIVRVLIDENVIADGISLTVDEQKDYTVPATIKAGPHKLTVEFTNDTYREGEVDSNLYIHGAKLIKK